jgi:hypothetical protein
MHWKIDWGSNKQCTSSSHGHVFLFNLRDSIRQHTCWTWNGNWNWNYYSHMTEKIARELQRPFDRKFVDLSDSTGIFTATAVLPLSLSQSRSLRLSQFLHSYAMEETLTQTSIKSSVWYWKIDTFIASHLEEETIVSYQAKESKMTAPGDSSKCSNNDSNGDEDAAAKRGHFTHLDNKWSQSRIELYYSLLSAYRTYLLSKGVIEKASFVSW